jgi:hypothetical protein
MIDRIRRRLDWTAYTVVMLCLIFITAGVAVHGLAADAHARRAQVSQMAQVAQVLASTKDLSVAKASLVYTGALMQAAVPASAPAAAPANVTVTPAPNPTVSAAVSDLLNLLLKLVGLAATAIVTALLRKWLGGKVSADTQAAYSKLAVDAIGHAEEMGHRAIKDNAAKLDSNAKLDAAVSFVMKGADDLKLVPRAEDAIKSLITAKLGGVRPPDATADKPAVPSTAVPPAPPVNPPTGKVA